MTSSDPEKLNESGTKNYLLLHKVEYPPGCGHHQVNLLVDPHNVVLQVRPACNPTMFRLV